MHGTSLQQNLCQLGRWQRAAYNGLQGLPHGTLLPAKPAAGHDAPSSRTVPCLSSCSMTHACRGADTNNMQRDKTVQVDDLLHAHQAVPPVRANVKETIFAFVAHELNLTGTASMHPCLTT
jgi:hypothetical protein